MVTDFDELLNSVKALRVHIKGCEDKHLFRLSKALGEVLEVSNTTLTEGLQLKPDYEAANEYIEKRKAEDPDCIITDFTDGVMWNWHLDEARNYLYCDNGFELLIERNKPCGWLVSINNIQDTNTGYFREAATLIGRFLGQGYYYISLYEHEINLFPNSNDKDSVEGKEDD